MAGPFYVDSAAGGANNGTSWTDAWTSIDSALTTVAAGEIIYIDDGHSENLAAVKAWTIVATAGNPYQILCVDKADDSLSSGAVIQSTGSGSYTLVFGGSVYMYGLNIQAGAWIRLDANEAGKVTVENCTLRMGVNNAGGVLTAGYTNEASHIDLIDTTVHLDGTGSYVTYINLRWRGGTLITDATIDYVFNQAGDGGSLHVTGVDLSAHSNNLVSIPASSRVIGPILIECCKVSAGSTIADATPLGIGSVWRMHHCDDGTDADPSYKMEERSYFGIVKVDTARYRTGGASDGVRSNPVSLEIASNASCKELYAFVESPPVCAWTAGDGSTSYTYKIYFASDATIQDDEAWMEIFLPNDASTSSQAARQSTRMSPQSTPANITSDGSSTWTGTGVGTKQELSVAYTPDKPGPVIARIYLAKASDTIYVDPLIEIT